MATVVKHFQVCNSFQAKRIFTKPFPVMWNTFRYFQMFNDCNFQICHMNEDGATLIALNDYSGVPSGKIEWYLTFLWHLQLFFFSSFFINLMRQIVVISFFMKCASLNVWKVAMSSIKRRKLPLRTVYKYQSIPWKQNSFQLYTQLLRLYTYKYSPVLFQFECYYFLQGLLHFHSFYFFHLEAKNKWLLNDLKQHNKSYISETSVSFFSYGNWYKRNITEVGCELQCCYITKWAVNIYW